jgi:pyruvate,water dikinase
MPVLVQQLVPADVSAVVFSVNPVSGDRGEVVVNASWGYGESVVGGTVTPDAYAVRRADLAIAGRVVADKRRMTVATPDGTAEVETPRFLRLQPALADDQVREAARLALALEAAMGWPVDIECAWAGGQLFLLQCRPVTGIGKR